MGSSQASARRDEAADTVIGFVLVTGISLVMISVVMLMGAPALEQVQSRQQMDSMVGAYQRLDRGISTLLSGAPAGTTPAWQVSMASGSLSIDQGGHHLWGYVSNLESEDQEYEFWFGAYADGDNQIDVENQGPAFGNNEFQVEAYRYEAGDEVASQTLAQSALANGASRTLTLNWDLAEHTTQLKLFDRDNEEGNQTVAQAWFVDGGAVEWELARSGSRMALLYQNTAILADVDDGQVMHNSPRLRAPDDSGTGQEDVFVRLVKLDGAMAIGGRSSSEMLLSSEGNHVRYSSSNTTQVQLYPPTSMIVAWERHLTNEAAGFTYNWTDSQSVFVGDEAAASYSSSDQLSTTLVQTDVVMSRSGGS